MTEAVVMQKSVLVGGHPRSGTSLVCQLVESGGIEFPSDFEGDEYNQGGYYEMEVAKDVSKDVIEEAMTPENTEKMNQVVRRLNDIKGWSGLKVVRIPSMFFYRHLAKEMKAVFVFRNPADVKASQFKRGIGEFHPSWYKNNNALIAGYENIEDSVVISYESVLNNPEGVKEALQEIGITIDTDIVDPEQQTQKESKVHVKQKERELYNRLKEIEFDYSSGNSGGVFGF